MQKTKFLRKKLKITLREIKILLQNFAILKSNNITRSMSFSRYFVFFNKYDFL